MPDPVNPDRPVGSGVVINTIQAADVIAVSKVFQTILQRFTIAVAPSFLFVG